MELYIIVFLAVVAIYTTLKWWQWFMTAAIFGAYVTEKFKPPSEEEMVAYAERLRKGAVKHWLNS